MGKRLYMASHRAAWESSWHSSWLPIEQMIQEAVRQKVESLLWLNLGSHMLFLPYSFDHEVSPIQCVRELHKGEIPGGRHHRVPSWWLAATISWVCFCCWFSLDSQSHFLPLCMSRFTSMVGFVLKLQMTLSFFYLKFCLSSIEQVE